MAGLRYGEQTKETILKDIRQRGLSVSQAAKKYQVSVKTIYSWINAPNAVSAAKLLAENRQLKRELESSCALLKDWQPTLKKITDRFN